MKNWEIITILVCCFLLSLGVIYFIEKKQKKCNIVVIMKDDRMYMCSETYTFYGLTRVIRCDGSIIDVPTLDIRTIEKIEF
jgi:hypothetical protein